MLKKLFGRKKEEQLKVIADENIADFNKLLDLFPESAYPDTEAREILLKRQEARYNLMGREVSPEKAKTGIRITIFEGNKGPFVRIWEEWLDAGGEWVKDTTVTWHDFQIDKIRETELLEKINSMKGSSPESEV